MLVGDPSEDDDEFIRGVWAGVSVVAALLVITYAVAFLR